MKEIKAFIRPQMLDAVVDALEGRPDTPGLTVSEVRGWGHVKGESSPRLTKKVKLEIVVSDEELDEVTSLIVEKARTGHSGDGKIFVSSVEEGVRIRTGERGKSAVGPSDRHPGHPRDGGDEGEDERGTP